MKSNSVGSVFRSAVTILFEYLGFIGSQVRILAETLYFFFSKTYAKNAFVKVIKVIFAFSNSFSSDLSNQIVFGQI